MQADTGTLFAFILSAVCLSVLRKQFIHDSACIFKLFMAYVKPYRVRLHITLVHPYSSNYNIVLMEAQEDQHRQARPEIKDPPANIDGYDTILLGYPNWWASIPMPIATFLESYDFSGKTIIPFCSHGGGRFGQSLTAIAKLAPDAVIGEGLSVHYSGGGALSGDVSDWLDTNGIKRK